MLGALLTACGGGNKSEDRPVSEAYYFEAQDTTQVLRMCDQFMSLVQERDYDHAFAQLYYFVDNQPVQVPLADLNALKDEFEHFPILDYKVESSDYVTPDNVTIVYKVRFMDKPADEPNFPDSYRIVFAPERINDTWYLGLAEQAKQ